MGKRDQLHGSQRLPCDDSDDDAHFATLCSFVSFVAKGFLVFPISSDDGDVGDPSPIRALHQS